MPQNIKEPLIQEIPLKRSKERIQNAVSEAYGEEFENDGFIILESGIPTFIQTRKPETISIIKDFGTKKKPRKTEKEIIKIPGRLKNYAQGAKYICPNCGNRLQENGDAFCMLTHLPIGDKYTKLAISRQRLRCPNKACRYNYTFEVEFKEDGHLITKALSTYIRDLLSWQLTLKEVSQITGVDQNIVKAIDKRRLEEKYTVNGEGKKLIKPEKQARYLGIDEFKLHDNRKYATVIIDLETGHVLYLAHTKQKKVVYEFMDYVGDKWMSGVKAVASDMNADYGEAFHVRYPDIQVVYDHFHIVQNFNSKVINEVKKDEVKRLQTEGNKEAAQALKGSKYILMSNYDTLLQKDRDARHEKILAKTGLLFNRPEIIQQGGNRKRYKELLSQNVLLFTADLVKEKLKFAYEADTKLKMKRRIDAVISLCLGTENEHFIWFANLLRNHYSGIISHAIYPISTGKVEGTNQMIKTLRRKSYGIPDDEYFFLKIMDASRK